jgi:hypothetical protein
MRHYQEQCLLCMFRWQGRSAGGAWGGAGSGVGNLGGNWRILCFLLWSRNPCFVKNFALDSMVATISKVVVEKKFCRWDRFYSRATLAKEAQLKAAIGYDANCSYYCLFWWIWSKSEWVPQIIVFLSGEFEYSISGLHNFSSPEQGPLCFKYY